MREIKFEYGFNSVNGIVKKVYYLHEIPFMHDKCDVWNMLPLFYVRQFTGLKDKNGVDIYEGDIINSNYFKNGKVVFWRYGWHFNTGKDCHHSFNTSSHSFEVIGNIYETPELLNK
jgi:hypothetical protein